METVPRIIQTAQNKAGHQEKQQNEVENLLPKLDLIAEEIINGKNDSGEAAEDIRKTFHGGDRRIRHQTGKHLSACFEEVRNRFGFQKTENTLPLLRYAVDTADNIHCQHMHFF